MVFEDVPRPPRQRNSSAPTGARDPFAWREALSPGISPASTARSSHAGSVCSNRSTPREVTPSSPHSAASASGSARSVLSSNSRRGGPPPPPYGPPPVSGPYPLPPAPFDGMHARSSSHYSASRSSQYATPESSARTSDFGSVYDSMSYNGSARSATPDLQNIYENTPALEPQVNEARPKRKKNAYAAAFDTFAPADGQNASTPSGPGPAARAKAPAAPSLDPLQVFSAARHGRHKDVEESLAAGFDPAFEDQYGNTLFHVACQNGNKRIAKLAIKYGGDMDAQNKKGNTGVHFLFSYGYQEIGNYFIEKGANEFIENESGNNVRSGIR